MKKRAIVSTKPIIGPLLLGVFVLFTAAAPAAAERAAVRSAADAWPGWGGPDHTLRVEAPLRLAAAPAVDLELVWQRPFGSGYSSVVVADGIAVSAAAQGDTDVLEAFDPATGATRWRLPMAPVFLGRSGSDDGPGATPVVADATVFMLHPAGTVIAADLGDGTERWRRDLVATLGAAVPVYGLTVSPVVADDVVVVPVGSAGKAMLAGLDTGTGAVRWTAGTDSVAHQNPILVRLAGRQQIVFPGDEHLWGIDPADGRVLWRHPLGFHMDAGQVVPVDGDRVLYTGANDQTFLLAIERTEGDPTGNGFAVRRIWHQPVLRNNHCVPIFHRDHFYGFDGRFLSAVRAEDGSVAWKSRPPGGQTVAMVDGHLFLWDGRGALTVVEATPEGYREKGRLPLSEQARVFTPPSYGAGLLFLRDLEQLYAVRVRPGMAGQPQDGVAGRSPGMGTGASGDLVETFLRTLMGAEPAERAEQIDRFLADHPRMPMVMPSGRVHFLYRGKVSDLAIQGDMTGRWPEEPMDPVAETDLYHRAYDLPLAERWEYRFKIFEDTEVDPANPEQIEGPDGVFSVVTGRDWREPEAFGAAPAPHRGRLQAVTVSDPSNDRSYAFRVYTPPGYDRAEDRRYPLVLFALGEQALSHGKAVDVLDKLGGQAFEPVIAIFLELPGSVWWQQNRERFIEIMDTLVMPRIEAGWRIEPGRAHRALVSRGWSSESATLFALGHPEHVGKLALQSPLYGATFLDRAAAPLLADPPGLAFYVDWGTFDVRNPSWPANVAVDAPALARRFADAGWSVTTRERGGGHNWTSWRAHIGTLLSVFFPVD